jgi:hybrid cluster-associated redox disulfide protein
LRWRNEAGRQPREDESVARTRVRLPTVQMTMAELLAGWPSARETVGRRGMACVGCAMARFETIGEAAAAYGFDARGLIDEVTDARAHIRPGPPVDPNASRRRQR